MFESRQQGELSHHDIVKKGDSSQAFCNWVLKDKLLAEQSCNLNLGECGMPKPDKLLWRHYPHRDVCLSHNCSVLN